MRTSMVAGFLALAVIAGCGKSDDSPASGGSSGSGGGGGSAAAGAKTPEQFFNDMKAAMVKSDGEALWGMFSANSRKWFVDQMKEMQAGIKDAPDSAVERMAKDFGVTPAELRTGDPEKLAKTMLSTEGKDPKKQEEAKNTTFVKADVQGDKAICETKDAKGPEWIVLVKEDGGWKFDVEESGKVDKEKKGIK